jgi:disulfide bond formation protein DsbB
MKYAVVALAVAVAGACGSVFLSLGLGLKACPLCFYQRTFVFAVAAVLGIGLLADRARSGLLCLLCVPLAVAGLGVAGFHEYLVLTDVLECPPGLLGLGTAPLQSLAVFVALTAFVGAGAWQSAEGRRTVRLLVVPAVVVGGVLAWASIAAAPPLPPAPKTAYDPVKQPLDMCRPAFRGE